MATTTDRGRKVKAEAGSEAAEAVRDTLEALAREGETNCAVVAGLCS
ncbi:MAG: hypothetical protein GXY55_21115 [Phycisphaerae bacterium]|nr:hypothetical protein [Phycisphaerae bacterium]